jgi:hypothetical protein
MRYFLRIIPALATILIFTAISAFAFHLDPSPDSEPPFVVCQQQHYALCAAASCFVYNGLAYCNCDIKKGDSVSLQLNYSTPSGEQNVCDANGRGRRNGYMLSTFSLPNNVRSGGDAAVYTCPGSDNAGSGVVAPVAYGQCDGGFCFKSTSGKRIPGFPQRLRNNQIICSCPISTDATAGSSDNYGYQIFGAYNPKAPIGSRCDANACLPCSVPNPTSNGAAIVVGAPTGTGDILTLKLYGPPIPDLNECLCSCQPSGPGGAIVCTVGEDLTAP